MTCSRNHPAFAGLPELKFSVQDAERAYHEWSCNCGPSALAAATEITLDEARKHLVGFDEKHYTNPTMMLGALRSLGLIWRKAGSRLPMRGLVRVQVHGPWMKEGVPIRARYRQTHWIATCWSVERQEWFVFDCNHPFSWCPEAWWGEEVMPALIKEGYTKSDGKFSNTHLIELMDNF